MAHDKSDKRGLASADEETRKRVASEGGKAAHEKGTAHEFTSEEAREAGQKGGETAFEEYGEDLMSQIGSKGSQTRGDKDESEEK